MPSAASPAAPASAAEITWAAVATVFGSLGGLFLCVDGAFRIIHACPSPDATLGDDAAGLEGRPLAAVLAGDGFAPGGPLRRALERGERVDRHCMRLAVDGGAAREVWLSAAPLRHADADAFPTEARYVVVLQPDADATTGDDAPGDGPPSLTAALQAHHWHRAETARALGISRVTLWRRMRDAGLH